MERYTDQVQIHIELRDHGLGEPESEHWYVAIDPHGAINREEVRDALLAELKQDNYTFSEKHSLVHWGASAEIYEIVMAVAGGAGGTLLAANIQAFVDKLRHGSPQPITEGQAIREARNTVCRSYPVDFGDLVLVEVELDHENKRARVELSAPDGSSYSVEVRREKEHVSVAKIVHRPA